MQLSLLVIINYLTNRKKKYLFEELYSLINEWIQCFICRVNSKNQNECWYELYIDTQYELNINWILFITNNLKLKIYK